MRFAIFALTKNGIKLGERLSRKIENASIFANPKGFKKSVRLAFKKYDGLIFIMASGIVVRTIAPLLKGKEKDPAVVVMDEKGRFVISLLSGHLGGANILAKRIATAIGARPVITTATDVNSLPCIEDIAKRFNLAIEDVKKIKVVNSVIVNGGRVGFVDGNAKRLKEIKGFVGSRRVPFGRGFRFYKSISQVQKVNADVFVIITHNSEPRTMSLRAKGEASPFIEIASGLKPLAMTTSELFILRPKDLVVGIGCDRGVSLKEIETAYFKMLKKFNLYPLSVKNLASIDVKKNEKGLLRFAKKYNFKIEFYSKNQLAKMPLPSGFSEFVMEKVGVGGVCEPAAMKSAGLSLRTLSRDVKRLLVKKQKIGRVTIAAAQISFS
ncbi:MAG: cobalt-precorrin 5A hydrolase [Deltaproteobacteria bacterium]|nr:cobalt-precorrin 5A hydrolase [Deltaproteobacteria bacterium]